MSNSSNNLRSFFLKFIGLRAVKSTAASSSGLFDAAADLASVETKGSNYGRSYAIPHLHHYQQQQQHGTTAATATSAAAASLAAASSGATAAAAAKTLSSSSSSVAASDVAQKRIVFCGEIHSVPEIIALQSALQETMTLSLVSPSLNSATSSDTPPLLHIVLEHFSFEMQSILDDYQDSKLTFDQLVERYHDIGTEGHDLEPYRSFLEQARQNQSVKLHAGFIPRTYARLLMQEGEHVALEKAKEKGWLPSDMETLEGSELHYNLFESLITGRDLYAQQRDDDDYIPPNDRLRIIFKAQLMKDASMAHSVNKLIEQQQQQSVATTTDTVATSAAIAAAAADAASMTSKNNNNNYHNKDKFLVIAGKGHMLHYQGVPERIFEKHPDLAADSILIICQEAERADMVETDGTASMDEGDTEATTTTTASLSTTESSSCIDESKEQQQVSDNNDTTTLTNMEQPTSSFLDGILLRLFGKPGTNPGDYLFVYESSAFEEDNDDDEAVAAKAETQAAYDKVGETAHLPGDLLKAAWIMYHLGYKEDEFLFVKEDAYNYQGVGNPHLHANIQPGERVLDVGSGLGVDSFLASKYAGSAGSVLGIDLSRAQVNHANRRAQARGLDTDKVRFVAGDMETMVSSKSSPLVPENSFDVAISNGAFCLAPNKRKAFEEIYKALKPGGRMAICTSTVQMDLEAGVNWPTCMRMFIHKNELKPMCEDIGFTNVMIDDSDSKMEFELPIPEEGEEEEEVVVQEQPQGNQSKDNSGKVCMKDQQQEQKPEKGKRRHKVHVGSEEFRHLQNYDMNQLCARVCVIATKPKEKGP